MIYSQQKRLGERRKNHLLICYAYLLLPALLALNTDHKTASQFGRIRFLSDPSWNLRGF